MAFLSEAYRLQGALDKAHELAHQGLQIAEETQNRFAAGWARRVLGRIAQARGSLEEAHCHLETALQTFTALSARFEMGRTHLNLAALAHTQGQPEATSPSSCRRAGPVLDLTGAKVR